ncbi:MAG: hypothetical protein AB7V62_04155 [Thermoleophilia bacterium]
MLRRALAPIGPVALALLVPAPALAGWSAPAVLTPRDGAAYAVPDVASERGRALAAWVRAPAGTRGRARVQIATRATLSARWTRPVMLSGSGADAPRVALNARGDAIVAWVSGRRVMAAVRRGPAGAWDVADVVDAGGAVADVRVAMTVAGRPTLLWSERSGSGFVVRIAARPSARAGWSARPPRIATPGPDPPAVALSRGGALVAWVDEGAVRAARTTNGTFERPAVIAEDAAHPAAAINASATSLAAWGTALPGGTPVMLASGRAAGASGWAVAEDVGIGLRPVAAINARGDAAVAWSLDEEGEQQGVEAATRRGARGSWRASTVVPRRECECALTVGGLGIDGRGAAVVGWHRDDGAAVGGGGAASLGPSAMAWSRASVAPGHLTRAPAVAGDPVAGGAAVWVEAGSRGGVRAVTLRP